MSYSSEVLADAPIAYYRLGEASGTTLVDSSGNGRDGTYALGGGSLLGQPGLLTGDADTSVKFISNSDVATVSVATHAAFKSTLVSCSARVKFAGAFGSQTIAGRYDGSLSDGAWVFRRDSGLLTAFVFIGGSYRVAQTATALADNVEYSVGFSWDGATIRLFVDGSAAGSATGAAATMNTGTADFSIGRRPTSATEGMFGWVDEVAVYDYRVPDTRFATLHNAATGVATPITVTGEAWSAHALQIDGTPRVGVRVAGQSWSTPATWLNGDIPVTTPIVVTGEAWSAPATLLDGTGRLAVPGEAWSAPADWLNGNIPGADIILTGEPWEAPATWLDGVHSPTRNGLGLILASTTLTTVTPPLQPLPTTGTTTPPVEHITTPTVPAPVLIDGKPQ